MKEYDIVYAAKFKHRIIVEDNEDVNDVIQDIEPGEGQYVKESFSVEDVTDLDVVQMYEKAASVLRANMGSRTDIEGFKDGMIAMLTLQYGQPLSVVRTEIESRI